MGPKQILLIWVRVDLRVIAMKGYCIFPKVPGMEPLHQMQFHVISRVHIRRVLPLSRGAVGIFYSLSRQGKFWGLRILVKTSSKIIHYGFFTTLSFVATKSNSLYEEHFSFTYIIITRLRITIYTYVTNNS